MKLYIKCLYILFCTYVAAQVKNNTIVIANCETCNCTTQGNESIQFKAICKGTNTEKVILTKLILNTEPLPNWRRSIYVRLENFKEADVRGCFISRWLAYSSCSLEVQDVGETEISEDFERLKDIPSFDFVFASLHIIRSRLRFIPEELFLDRNYAVLNLINADVYYLNLIGLTADRWRRVIIKNSRIKIFAGDILHPLIVNHVSIQNSKIGILRKGALEPQNSPPHKYSKVIIFNTVIGMMESSSIVARKNVIMIIRNCHLVITQNSPIQIKENSGVLLGMRTNVIPTQMNFMKNLKCSDKGIDISNNLFISLKSNCSIATNESCNGDRNIFDIIDSSCSNNTLMQLAFKYENKHEKQATKPMNSALLYILSGLCCILFIKVVILMIALKKQQIQQLHKVNALELQHTNGNSASLLNNSDSSITKTSE